MSRGVHGLALVLLVAVLGCGALLVPGRAAAQSRPDSAAVLLGAARRFEAEGRTAIADALMEMILERFGDTAAAAEVRRLRAALPADRGMRSGTVELQVWSTLYGLWVGVAVPLMADAEDPTPYGVGLLVGGPIGLLTSRSYANSRSLSEGQARAITWGGTWGTWQGLGWAEVLDFGQRTERVCDSSGSQCFEIQTGDGSQETVGAMVVGGVAGIIAGGLLSRKAISRGLATTVSFGSLWGTWFGFGIAYLADLDDDDLLAGTLLGGNAGLVTTAVLGPGWQLSRNRARLISIAGVLGALGGAGILLIAQPEDDKVEMMIPLAGSIAGLAIGATATRGYDAALDGGEEGGGNGALLQLERGRWTLDVPVPVPSLQRVDARNGARVGPALAIPLLRARF